jgi:hypothetical protein
MSTLVAVDLAYWQQTILRVVGVLAAVLPSIKAARLNVLQAIAHE